MTTNYLNSSDSKVFITTVVLLINTNGHQLLQTKLWPNEEFLRPATTHVTTVIHYLQIIYFLLQRTNFDTYCKAINAEIVNLLENSQELRISELRINCLSSSD